MDARVRGQDAHRRVLAWTIAPVTVKGLKTAHAHDVLPQLAPGGAGHVFMNEENETAQEAAVAAAAGTSRAPAFNVLLLIPNILTLCAVLCGLTALRLSAEGEFDWAIAAIFGAVVLDTADGYLARLLGAESPIGAELDSLADFVSFGVAPAMLIYQRDLHLLGWAGWLIAGVYVLATGLRLARFNVQSRLPKEPGQKNWFCGLPSTGAAVAVLIADAAANAALLPDQASLVMAVIVFAAGALMVSELRVPALFRR
jgi:CDP-diacylglycerol--serine O-phosphatidyltransferase